MTLILLAFLCGLIVGFRPETPEIIIGFSQKLLSIGLIFLLFFLGAELGTSPDIIFQLQWIGLKAFIHALFTVAGSVLAVWILEKRIFKYHTYTGKSN